MHFTGYKKKSIAVTHTVFKSQNSDISFHLDFTDRARERATTYVLENVFMYNALTL